MQCHHVKALDAFFEGIQSSPIKLAVIGSGCSVATEPVAEISHRWNISQVNDDSGSQCNDIYFLHPITNQFACIQTQALFAAP